jgi:phosphatidylinositol alpha-1,6-mannosyltransferase
MSRSNNLPFNFAIITENLLSGYGGGITEWTLGVAENFARMGHRVVIYSKWKKKHKVNDIINSKLFDIKPMRGHDWRKFRFFYTLYYVWKYLFHNPFGVIVATTWELGYSFVFLKRLYPRAKLIVIAHGRDVTRVKDGRLLKHFRITIKAANMVVAVSRFTQNEIQKRLKDKKSNHIIFIPNGVDIKRFHIENNTKEIRDQFGIGEKNRVILTLARVIERKGHDIVIKSLPQILKEFPETQYLIAGPWENEYYEKLKNLVKKLNLEDKVVFSGYIDEIEKNKYYNIGDVYVMLSRIIDTKGDSEGFGITFLEANACKKPVIGTYSGGIPDAIEDNVNGYLIHTDNIDEFVEKILTLFRNNEIMEKLGSQGYERILNNFTWEKVTKNILDKFEQYSQNDFK